MANELQQALADDLAGLIRLHDRELDRETLLALQTSDFPESLALLPGDGSVVFMQTVVAGLGSDPATLDQLAADYAAVYLSGAAGASPCESVWLSDAHLNCEAPMFALREIYAAAGLAGGNWRQRHDDHLVLQLHFLWHQLQKDAPDWAAVAELIDFHLGFWLPDFTAQLARHGDSPFYTGLAALTTGWLTAFRELLAESQNLPIPGREQVRAQIQAAQAQAKSNVAPVHFMPGGTGPSW
jgi:TorA maturation chaperone TorD